MTTVDEAPASATRARVDVLMITHRRPEYTRLVLPRLLEATGDHVRVWLWHNGEHAPTLEVARRYADHPRIARFHHSPENLGLRAPTNWLWEGSKAPYLSKVDDDCLVDHAWTDPLLDAHGHNPAFGVLGAWRFLDEDFRPRLANRKIRTFDGGHRLLLNLWVQGSSYVMKREVVDRIGLLREDDTFPRYCRRAAEAGFVNGWLYPFVREQHLDDPRLVQSALRDVASLQANLPLSAKVEGIRTVAQWEREMRVSALRVQRASLNPARHHGMWGKAITARKRLRRLARKAGLPV